VAIDSVINGERRGGGSGAVETLPPEGVSKCNTHSSKMVGNNFPTLNSFAVFRENGNRL